MKNLCIDIGNTSVKVGVFENEALLVKEQWDDVQFLSLKKLVEEFQVTQAIVISGRLSQLISDQLATLVPVLTMNAETPVPIKNVYLSKHTLGLDRLVASVGANYLYPDTDLMVIDAGTAITYEFISSEGVYLGGNISPGMQIRFKALHQFTGKLPMCQYRVMANPMGKDTQTAVINGVFQGMLKEINGYIDEFYAQHNNGKVVMTGGDAYFFDNSLNNSIFVEKNLILTGLNRILEFNALL